MNDMSQENLKTEFDETLKEVIIPFFKEFGFKRKSQNFYRQINDIGQCFNVQRSQWSPVNDSITFTFNLGFFSQEIFKIVTEKSEMIEFAKTTDCFIQSRLGIYSHGRDHWYTLARNIKKDDIKTQIEKDLTNHLKPLFEKYTSLDSLKELVAKDEKRVGPVFAPYYLIVFYMTTGQTRKGIQTIKEHYLKAHKPMTVPDRVNHPDGRKETKTRTSINQFYIDVIERLAKLYDVTLDSEDEKKERKNWFKRLFNN
jgi:hypothetical protein